MFPLGAGPAAVRSFSGLLKRSFRIVDPGTPATIDAIPRGVTI